MPGSRSVLSMLSPALDLDPVVPLTNGPWAEVTASSKPRPRDMLCTSAHWLACQPSPWEGGARQPLPQGEQTWAHPPRSPQPSPGSITDPQTGEQCHPRREELNAYWCVPLSFCGCL